METKAKAIKKVSTKEKIVQTARSVPNAIKTVISDSMSFETFMIAVAVLGTTTVMVYGITPLTLSAVLASVVVIGLSGTIFDGNT